MAEPGPLCVAITGANRGLGRELVQQYAGQGARVLALSRRPPENVPKTVVWHRVDLSDASAIESLSTKLAGQPIDILINNAAIRGATGGLSAVAAQDFARVMAVNALAPVLLTRALLPNLRAGSARCCDDFQPRGIAGRGA
ncbi:MAG: SDR family NAD(P)-dependent oxidoreductase [Paracoccaceae bacterium]